MCSKSSSRTPEILQLPSKHIRSIVNCFCLCHKEIVARVVVDLLKVDWQSGAVACFLKLLKQIGVGKLGIPVHLLFTKRLNTFISSVDYFVVSLGILELVNKWEIIAPTLLAVHTVLNFFFGLISFVVHVGDWLKHVLFEDTRFIHLGELFSRWGSLLLQTSSVRHRGHADGDQEG